MIGLGNDCFTQKKPRSDSKPRCADCGSMNIEWAWNMRTNRKMWACHKCGSHNDYHVWRLHDASMYFLGRTK